MCSKMYESRNTIAENTMRKSIYFHLPNKVRKERNTVWFVVKNTPTRRAGSSGDTARPNDGGCLYINGLLSLFAYLHCYFAIVSLMSVKSLR